MRFPNLTPYVAIYLLVWLGVRATQRPPLETLRKTDTEAPAAQLERVETPAQIARRRAKEIFECESRGWIAVDLAGPISSRGIGCAQRLGGP